MAVPLSQMWTVARYVLGKKLRRVQRYPVVLMLEPLFRCNLACAGCGKIQYPGEILKRQLSLEECLRAVDECGAPIVSIPGGEPLLHPDIDRIVEGIVARRKYVYLCTNAILLKRELDRFMPSKYLTFSIHIDGEREEHDQAVCREGVYDVAVEATRAAIERGFRVTTNTTLFNTADPERVREMFDTLTDLGVEGMMVSPGYPYAKAPDQEHFLHRNETVGLFRRIFSTTKRRWRFNQSPLFLEFLKGNWHLECTPWGNPTYNIFGWQKPCYLLQEGYCETFQELLDTTDWDSYGCASGNPRCTDCMVHSGYEPTAVSETFGSLRGLMRTARLVLFGARPTQANGAVEGGSNGSHHKPPAAAALVELDSRAPATRLGGRN
ncbi:MAG: adenosyl-hopene transferase HpnH [Planctomycetes bacterium]|nr:adenosyl-hopene transferase HpnH [Planctomycetota bacterium]